VSLPLLALASAAAACLLTFVIRRMALARGLLDVPNERSSHRIPTPRGGGFAIVLVATAAFCWLAVTRRLDGAAFAALMGGLAVAAVGLIDDRRPVSPGLRLAAHLAAALWALAWLGGLPPLRFGDHLVALGAAGAVVGGLGIVWALNLFNFMDGIDGIAASEATFVAWAGAALTAAPPTGGVSAAAVMFGAACLGFLPWNWPAARIFMGDAGSGYLGFVISVLAVATARDNPAALWVWLILGGVFFVDATVTLLHRLLRGEPVQQAHRTHAYQWLARRWRSHLKVTLAVQAVNLLWLLPCALLAALHPGAAAAVTVLALTPIAALAIAAGSGRSETPERERS
jgi:Fuc2NAc and GlcNAc transferase